MADKDLKSVKKKVSSTTTVSMESKQEKPPAGAILKEQSIRTETEEIENGWLVTKSYSGYYWRNKEEQKGDSYGSYFNYCKKWFSKEDPLTIEVNDKSLAEAFNDEE